MSRILYITVANYDHKHLDSSKIGLENSWIFFLTKEWEPCKRNDWLFVKKMMWVDD